MTQPPRVLLLVIPCILLGPNGFQIFIELAVFGQIYLLLHQTKTYLVWVTIEQFCCKYIYILPLTKHNTPIFINNIKPC